MIRPWSAAVLIFLLGCTHASSNTAGPADPTGRVNALADSYFEQILQLDPIFASQIGDHRYDDRLPDDLSVSGRNAIRAVHERARAELAAIDRSKLSGQALLTWEVLDDRTRAGLDALRFSDHLMPVEQLGSLPVSFPVLGSGAGSHRFETVKDYENFLARIAAFDGWVKQLISNLREGMATGYTRPRPVMERVLPQLEAVAGKKPEETAFWGPVQRLPASFSAADRERLTTAYREAIGTRLVPTYDRLLAFVRDEYLPKCRTTTAIEALPDGKERYAFLVRDSTTSSLDAHAIHELGHREVKRILGEVDVLRKAAGKEGTAAEFLAAMRLDPQGTVATPEALLSGYVAMKSRVSAHLPSLFGKLPKADFEVRLIEPFREGAAPSQYAPATPDGSRPGIFYANGAALKQRPVRPSESLFLHEALPGHHLQVALASENTGLPRLRRFAPYNAYVEGWALYAERLGPEVGLYQGTPSRAGAYSSELFRAMRLVVDTGLHHEGWSRERAIQYLAETGGLRPEAVSLEVDRYLASPGQALGYKIGEIAIRDLLAKARERLGPKFDLRAFHDAILENGALPLDSLERAMTSWMEGR